LFFPIVVIEAEPLRRTLQELIDLNALRNSGLVWEKIDHIDRAINIRRVI
jgi:hypothetical protein